MRVLNDSITFIKKKTIYKIQYIKKTAISPCKKRSFRDNSKLIKVLYIFHKTTELRNNS